MLGKSSRGLVCALGMFCVLVMLELPVSHAAPTSGDKITGTIVFVDSPTGLLWLTDPDGRITKIAASTQLLGHLQKGDRVEVSVTEQPRATQAERASQDTSTARVRAVMPELGVLSLLTEQGEIFAMQPSRSLFASLQPGDTVQVTVQKITDAQPAGAKPQTYHRQQGEQPEQGMRQR
jgi:hypothetical protein